MTVPCRVSIPPYFENILQSNKDWNKISEDKEATLDFIMEIKDSPLFAEINYNIQEEIKGINGNIQFEFYDVIEKVNYLLNYYQKGLDKTLFLWYNTSKNNDITDNTTNSTIGNMANNVLEGSLLNIESYLKY
jgi:hypothetical protein